MHQTGNWSNFQQDVVDTLNQNRTSNTTNEITAIAKTVGDVWPTPAYDANGNMTEFPQPDDLTSSFDATWNAWNRLVTLEDSSDTIAGYQYDGLGRRVIKEKYTSGSLSATVHCYYSSQVQCLEERIDTSTAAATQYLWGLRFVNDLVLRDRDTNSNGTMDEWLYALCDPRFSILAITDATGTVQERYSYDGYGKTRIYTPGFVDRATSNFAWEFRYTGRRQDLETGVYFFRARYYHAQLGRFISRDSTEYVDGMSLYRAYFVPFGTDPSGNRWVMVRVGSANCRYYPLKNGKCNIHCKCPSPSFPSWPDHYSYYDRSCTRTINPPSCYDWEWVDDPVTVPDPVPKCPPIFTVPVPEPEVPTVPENPGGPTGVPIPPIPPFNPNSPIPNPGLRPAPGGGI